MDEKQKLNYSLILTIALTVIGWSVTAGVTSQKIATLERDVSRVEITHKEDIEKVTERANNTDALLQSINTQLVELNTKMTLLLKGNLKTEE